ncbi:DUF1641 domain-containing protein [Alicyclobacillus shizuokensis]|uniref:DUF1641 domain-containing protein n=1 Tax=Alicyclobacillus shizuokensis TaxID=392014 RepID=UPI00082DD8EA|nr:DUF1641 domain-containing protein [Alicyclobacillus shizuokensis]MCL6627221.1 DUF1641 domain-containing protein [Alicyclobacillus shizuokensis]
MAKPVTTVVPAQTDEAEAQAKAMERLQQMAAADVDALAEVLRLARALHDRGLLTLAAALLEQADDVLRIVVDLVNQPGAVRGLKNLVTAAQALGAVDLEAFSRLAQGAAASVEEAKADRKALETPLGFFKLLAYLADPDVSAAIRLLLAACKGVGRALRAEAESEAEGV